LKHFSHRVQCKTKSCRSCHFEFHIGTKNLKSVEDRKVL
jgi:ferredoxin